MTTGRRVSVAAPASLCILGDPGDLFGGCVLACTVDVSSTVEVSDSPAIEIWAGEQSRLIKWAGDLKSQGDVWDVACVVLEFLDWGLEPVKIRYCGGPQWGWGLGDHAATLVALLRALSTWRGQQVSPYQLAESAYVLEREALGFTGSLCAAYIAAFGGLCFLDFRGRGGPGSAARVYGTVERLSPPAEDLPLLAAHMGPGRPARDSVAGLQERWLVGDRRVVESYQIIDGLVQEGKRAVLDQDWERLGKLMNENAIIQSNMTATDSFSDQLVDVALRAGAWGVRPLGVGEYGTIVALHPDPPALAKAWTEAGAETIQVVVKQEVGNG
jgi:galactokinase/mevalonate kinase-like predicted kinase